MQYLLQVGCIALIGMCGIEGCAKPPSAEVRSEIKEPFRETQIKPADDWLSKADSSSILQILKLDTGSLALSVYENTGEISSNRLVLVNKDLQLVDAFELGMDRPLNFGMLGAGELAYATDRGELYEDGTFRSRVEVKKVSLSDHKESVLSWGSFEFESGYAASHGWMSYEEVKKTRKNRRSLYEQVALEDSAIQFAPVFYPQTNQVFVDHYMESMLCEMGAGSQIPVQPILKEPISGLVGRTRLKVVSGAPGYFSTVAEQKELRDIIGDAFVPASEPAERSHKFLLLAKLELGKSPSYSFLPLKSSGVTLFQVTLKNGVYYFVGSADNPTSRSRNRMSAWIASYDGKELREKIITLPKMSTATVVDVESKKTVIAGICDYDQATTGSMGDTSGFIMSLSADLRPLSTVILRGKRSTQVHDIVLDGNRVFVAGSTDGPNTHATNRSKRAFIGKVEME